MFFLYIYICYIHKGVWGAYEAVCLSNWSKYAQSLCIYYRQLTLQLRERELHAAWWLFVFFVIWRRIFLSFICYVGAIYTCSATVNLRKPSCHISASQMSRKARSFLWLWVDVKIDQWSSGLGGGDYKGMTWGVWGVMRLFFVLIVWGLHKSIHLLKFIGLIELFTKKNFQIYCVIIYRTNL